jgi:long-chain acyl-CoA synthetase
LLIDPLFTHAATKPSALAIIDDGGRRYTYQQLAAMTHGLSHFIATATKNPRIGIVLPAGAGFVASFYGALAAGKTVVPLNFLLSDREIAHCIADSGIDSLITIPALAARLKNTSLKIIDLTQVPPPSTSTPSPTRTGSTPGSPPAAPAAAAPDVIAVLMYTSGTSGLPKGVLLSYGNLQSNVDAAIAHVSFQHNHRFLGVVPLFHAFGMIAMMLAPIQLGATIVYLARFSPVAALDAVREHGISLMGGVPSMYAAMLRLKEAAAADFKTLYAAISGAEPLPPTLREGFAARFGITLLDAYGMTETSLAIAVNTPRMNKPDSVGKPVPGAEIRIVDDEGNALAARGVGASGEIWVKGPMVMRGYHNLPDETAAALAPDGYFKTGDIGHFDADGFLHLTGRKKDLIIVAGEKVAPREIEELLLSHPAIADAAVIGRGDRSRGEAVIAFVTLREETTEGRRPAAEELRRFCRDCGLPAWKVPREIYIVAELPRSPTGKILKRDLRPPPAPPAADASQPPPSPHVE